MRFVSGFQPFRAVVFLHYLIVKDQENGNRSPEFQFTHTFYTHKCQKVSEKVLTFVRNAARKRENEPQMERKRSPGTALTLRPQPFIMRSALPLPCP
jgi:hypothetical protein